MLGRSESSSWLDWTFWYNWGHIWVGFSRTRRRKHTRSAHEVVRYRWGNLEIDRRHGRWRAKLETTTAYSHFRILMKDVDSSFYYWTKWKPEMFLPAMFLANVNPTMLLLWNRWHCAVILSLQLKHARKVHFSPCQFHFIAQVSDRIRQKFLRPIYSYLPYVRCHEFSTRRSTAWLHNSSQISHHVCRSLGLLLWNIIQQLKAFEYQSLGLAFLIHLSQWHHLYN